MPRLLAKCEHIGRFPRNLRMCKNATKKKNRWKIARKDRFSRENRSKFSPFLVLQLLERVVSITTKRTPPTPPLLVVAATMGFLLTTISYACALVTLIAETLCISAGYVTTMTATHNLHTESAAIISSLNPLVLVPTIFFLFSILQPVHSVWISRGEHIPNPPIFEVVVGHGHCFIFASFPWRRYPCLLLYLRGY